jgi:hypothetical protein
MDNDQTVILQLKNRLNENDRERLQLFLGDDIPRRLKEDSSLSGIFNRIQSLLDQDQIDEQEFIFLISAFEKIQCYDAANLLRGNYR